MLSCTMQREEVEQMSSRSSPYGSVDMVNPPGQDVASRNPNEGTIKILLEAAKQLKELKESSCMRTDIQNNVSELLRTSESTKNAETTGNQAVVRTGPVKITLRSQATSPASQSLLGSINEYEAKAATRLANANRRPSRSESRQSAYNATINEGERQTMSYQSNTGIGPASEGSARNCGNNGQVTSPYQTNVEMDDNIQQYNSVHMNIHSVNKL